MFKVEGRLVKVVTGTSSQTINVYADNDVAGVYDPKLRIRDRSRFVTQDLLAEQNFETVEQLVGFLTDERGAKKETVGGTSTGSGRVLPKVVDHDLEWGSTVVDSVEQCINRLVDGFIRAPYLHRVEHSLHCELFLELMSVSGIDETCEVEGLMYRTLQKEWPETVPRPEKAGRRGSFDLVILGPRAPGGAPLELSQYCDGLLKPAFALELGLDYDLGHLRQDAAKLRNSGIQHSYLVHFARDTGRRQEGVEAFVEELISQEADGGPRVAYAHYSGGAFRIRRIGEPTITGVGAEPTS